MKVSDQTETIGSVGAPCDSFLKSTKRYLRGSVLLCSPKSTKNYLTESVQIGKELCKSVSFSERVLQNLQNMEG